MKKLELMQMEGLQGGQRINCKTAGRGATILGGIGLGLTAIAFVASGPVGVAVGIMSGIWGVGSGAAGLGIGIACW